jgi:recombinational DNA repair protein RecR
MTKAIERVLKEMADHLDRTKICAVCRDKTKCDECSFSKEGGPSA